MAVLISLETSSDVPAFFLPSFLNGMRLSQEPRSFDVFFELQMIADRHQPVRPVVRFLLLWAISPFEDPQDSLVPYRYS